jgi:hypothetical protein
MSNQIQPITICMNIDKHSALLILICKNWDNNSNYLQK